MNPDQLLKKAQTSPFYLFVLNTVLARVIPFNKPHGIKILNITDQSVYVRLPYKRINQNHLKGMHACALATVAEFTCGIALINVLGSKNYRLIMKDMKVNYLSQGKTDVYTNFHIDVNEIVSEINASADRTIFKRCNIEIKDLRQKTICIADINWQIKSWDKVKKI